MIRPARLQDATAIAQVHVAAWRSAYAGLLPAPYLASLSLPRHAARHEAAIRAGHTVLVAEMPGSNETPLIVGFATAGHPRRPGLGDGEIETLYVLDDWRDQGIGRALLQQAARSLATIGCRTVFLWVLEDNPSRWFYQRLGGRPIQRATTHVAGQPFQQTAYLWDPVDLLHPTPSEP